MTERNTADSGPIEKDALVRLAKAAYEQGYRHGRGAERRAHIERSGER